MAERGLPWKGRVSCPCPSQYPCTGTFGLLWSSLGKDMADIGVATSSGIQDGTEQMALEHGQTVTSRALVVESSVTTRTLVDIILILV